MKFIIAGALAAASFAAPAFAGPYVETEVNSSFSGSDYTGSTVEPHVGYEGELTDTVGWFAQAGPAFVFEDGKGVDTEFSGKVGLDVDLSESWSAYNEVSFLTGDVNSYGLKGGVRYTF